MGLSLLLPGPLSPRSKKRAAEEKLLNVGPLSASSDEDDDDDDDDSDLEPPSPISSPNVNLAPKHVTPKIPLSLAVAVSQRSRATGEESSRVMGQTSRGRLAGPRAAPQRNHVSGVPVALMTPRTKQERREQEMARVMGELYRGKTLVTHVEPPPRCVDHCCCWTTAAAGDRFSGVVRGAVSDERCSEW